MLKYFKWVLTPLALLTACFIFMGYMAWNEYSIKNTLVVRALEGNRYAIKILAQYEKPGNLDRGVVFSALEANKYALEILKIPDEGVSGDTR